MATTADFLRSEASSTERPRALIIWLFSVALLIIAMVAVGGITRLTESGLSMVRWEPVTGVVPPIGDNQWQAEFAAYKAYPEYQKLNRGMTLDEFKNIFFWEYLHRLLGRLIGIAYALPLAWFAWRRAIPPGYGSRLLALLALGAGQGALGWWMVASGLIDRPDVSHERLAAHLSVALVLLTGIVWTALDLRALPAPRSRFPVVAMPLAVLLACQIILGAFVAGLNAGHAFNSWPKMGDEWFPAAVPMLSPAWRNLLDNPIVVQFAHRTLAWAVVVAALVTAWSAARRAATRPAIALVLIVAVQFGLGVATLVSGVAIGIAATHQLCAALLAVAVTATAHALGKNPQ